MTDSALRCLVIDQIFQVQRASNPSWTGSAARQGRQHASSGLCEGGHTYTGLHVGFEQTNRLPITKSLHNLKASSIPTLLVELHMGLGCRTFIRTMTCVKH